MIPNLRTPVTAISIFKRSFTCLIVPLFLFGNKCYAQYTPGNLLVEQVQSTSSNAAQIYLLEYTTGGTLVSTTQLPVTSTLTVNRLTESGSASSSGEMNLSANGRYVTVPGYDAATGTSGVTSNSNTNRIIARLDGSGISSIATTVLTESNGANSNNTYIQNNFRSVVTNDGTRYWLAGASTNNNDGSDGVRTVAFSGTTVTATTSSEVNAGGSSANLDNTRVARIYNGQLYYTTGSGTAGLYSVGTGIPSNSGNSVSLVFTPQSGSTSPYSFVFISAGGSNMVAYVVDDHSSSQGGIYKYYYNGSTWSAMGSVLGKQLYGLAATVSGTTVSLYSTDASHIYSTTDAAGFSSSMTGSFSTLVTISGTAFKGISLTPAEIVTTTASYGPLCDGSVITVPFTYKGHFTGNFVAQLSNSSGVFPSDNVSNIIGIVAASTNPSSVSATIPGAQAAGTSYRIRILNNVTGPTTYYNTDNGSNITINASVAASAGSAITQCGNAAITMTGSTASGTISSISWTGGSGSGTWSGSGTNPATYVFTPSTASGSFTATLTVNGTSPCANATDTRTITWNQAVGAVAGSAITQCGNAAITMTGSSASGTISSISWTGGSGSGTWFGSGTNPASYVFTPSSASGSFTATLTVNGTSPCGNATDTRTITWNTTSVITPSTPITYCQNDIATALIATGTNLLWYASATGGTGNAAAPVPSTAIVGSPAVSYWVTQTLNSCESGRAEIDVDVNPLPTAAVSGGNVSVCVGGTIPDVLVTVNNGETADWYADVSGGSVLPGGLGVTSFATGQTEVGSYTYYAQARNTATACNSSIRTPVSLTIGSSISNFTATILGCSMVDSAESVMANDSNLIILAATGGTQPYVFSSSNSSDKVRSIIADDEQEFTAPFDGTIRTFSVQDAAGCVANASVITSNLNPQTIPYTSGTGRTSATCYDNGLSKWITFYDSNNQAVAEINDAGNDLGNITITIYKDSNNIIANNCGAEEAALMRHFLIHSDISNQSFNPPVKVRLFFSEPELQSLRVQSHQNNTSSMCTQRDDINSINDLFVTKYDGPNEDSLYSNNFAGGIYKIYGDNTYGSTSGALYKDSLGFQNIFNGGQAHHYVQLSVTEFSELWLNGSNQESEALPVEILYLEAEAVDNAYIRLAWATAAEINNNHFLIERSNDGQNWDSVGVVMGHGNTTSESDYTFNDMQVSAGRPYYYRLKQIDNNGQFNFTNTVSASLIGGEGLAISDFIPNPASEQGSLFVSCGQEVELTVDIYDITGRKLISNAQRISAGGGRMNFELNKLAAGTYSAILKCGTEVFTRRLVISR